MFGLSQRLCTQAAIWKRLRHQNVVRFLGLRSDYPPLSLVYQWLSNENLSEYLHRHTDVDKLSLVCGYYRRGCRLLGNVTLALYRHQLLDVAHGLTYLHQRNLVHGNLTGVSINLLVPRSGRLTIPQDNILVDGNGVACISECGLEIFLRDEPSYKSVQTNVRWMAPEVLGAMGRRIQFDGKAADIYAFTMIVFEVGIPIFTRKFEPHLKPHPSFPGLIRHHSVLQRKRRGNCG